jgi:hypothetical protein
MKITGSRRAGPSTGCDSTTVGAGVRKRKVSALASVPPVADFAPAGLREGDRDLGRDRHVAVGLMAQDGERSLRGRVGRGGAVRRREGVLDGGAGARRRQRLVAQREALLVALLVDEGGEARQDLLRVALGQRDRLRDREAIDAPFGRAFAELQRESGL